VNQIKVVMAGMKGDFSRYSGEGVFTYTYEVYSNLIKQKNISLKKVEIEPYPLLDKGVSFMLKFSRMDFSKYDIIHNPAARASFPHNRGKALLVSTAHDFQPIIAPEQMIETRIPKTKAEIRDQMRLEFLKKFSLVSVLKSDYIIARSSLTKEDAIKLGYDKNKITIDNNCLDKRYLTKIPSKKEKKTFTVGYLGALRKRKNVGFAIKGFMKLRDKNVNLQIWGNRKYQYKKLVEEAQYDRRVHFMGFAPEEKIVQIYDSFNAFIFPSLYEGVGQPIFEAQSRGIPTIIYKEGKIPKEIRKYCFEASDTEDIAHIIEALKSNGYNEKQRKKAMEYARGFTWDKSAKITAKLYSDLV
jgi:glycosyltransferase involved in cell wall biosynthesis